VIHLTDNRWHAMMSATLWRVGLLRVCASWRVEHYAYCGCPDDAGAAYAGFEKVTSRNRLLVVVGAGESCDEFFIASIPQP